MPNIPKEKIDAIYKYLKEQFPDCEIHDQPDEEYIGQKFRVSCDKSDHLVTVRYAFFQDHTIKQISSRLEASDLSDQLKKKPGILLFVTKDGFIREKWNES